MTYTPPAEAVDAAESGMYQRMTWASLHWNALDPDQQRELATAALSAAAPFIAAQAKAEALRDAADEADDPSPEEMDFYQIDQAQVGNWLRARAASIKEGKTNEWD